MKKKKISCRHKPNRCSLSLKLFSNFSLKLNHPCLSDVGFTIGGMRGLCFFSYISVMLMAFLVALTQELSLLFWPCAVRKPTELRRSGRCSLKRDSKSGVSSLTSARGRQMEKVFSQIWYLCGNCGSRVLQFRWGQRRICMASQD